MRRNMTAGEFRKLMTETPDFRPDNVRLRKAYVTEAQKQEGETPAIRFTISTQDVDRAGDIVYADGWNFANYRKNPVVLWCHDYHAAPIGKTTKIEVRGKKVMAECQFAVELDPFFRLVYDLYAGGYMSAVSVGFNPLKWQFAEEGSGRRGVDYLEQELLEYSAVPVPCNANALIAARSAGLDTAPLRDWAGAQLDIAGEQRYVEVGGIMLPKPALEGMFRQADPTEHETVLLTGFDVSSLDVVAEDAPEPEQKSATPVHHTETDDARWDAGANEKRVKSDGTRAYYNRIYGWRDPDNEAKTAYKFIHHMIAQDGTPGAASIRACSAGIAILNGGRGGADIPEDDRLGVWRHLAAHLRDADREPPPLKDFDEEDKKAFDREGYNDMNAKKQSEPATPDGGAMAQAGGPDADGTAPDKIAPDTGADQNGDEPDNTGLVAARSAARPSGWSRFRHHADNGAVLWAGVVEAMAALLEGEQPTGHEFNVPAKICSAADAYLHLKAHYLEDFDEVAPEWRYVEARALKNMPDVLRLDRETGALVVVDQQDQYRAAVEDWVKNLMAVAGTTGVRRAIENHQHAGNIRLALRLLEDAAHGTGDDIPDEVVEHVLQQVPVMVGEAISRLMPGR